MFLITVPYQHHSKLRYASLPRATSAWTVSGYVGAEQYAVKWGKIKKTAKRITNYRRVAHVYLFQNLRAYNSEWHKQALNLWKHSLDCQHGFRSRRCCKAQLVQFYIDTVSNLAGTHKYGHKQMDLIIMDFAKAFNKVPHRRLMYMYKVYYYGIGCSTQRWIDMHDGNFGTHNQLIWMALL